MLTVAEVFFFWDRFHVFVWDSSLSACRPLFAICVFFVSQQHTEQHLSELDPVKFGVGSAGLVRLIRLVNGDDRFANSLSLFYAHHANGE